MGQKITDYPNEQTLFDESDKFDISAKIVGGYESKWYSPATLFANVYNYIQNLFVKEFVVDRATAIDLQDTGALIRYAKYIITDSAVTGGFPIVVYAVTNNKLSEFGYLLRTYGVGPFSPNPACFFYDVNFDTIRHSDSTFSESKFQLALYYNGGYFTRGQTIEINDADQGLVRVVAINENSTSSAATLLGFQNGGTSPNVTGYHGNYDNITDVFVHDIVHFRREIDASIINTGTGAMGVSVAIDECLLPPAGYAWEVLSANVWRQAGSSYGTNPIISVGYQSILKFQYWDNSIHLLRFTPENWTNLTRIDNTTSKCIVEDERLTVNISNVSLTGTGRIVVHGTARLMKK